MRLSYSTDRTGAIALTSDHGSEAAHPISWGDVSRDEPWGPAREYMKPKCIAQRLHMGSWNYVSNLLNEQPQTHPQAQEELRLCQ